MRIISFAWTAVLLCTVCKAQFFYNDDEQYQPAFQEPIQGNTYVYNSPSAVAQHNPSQQSSHSENFDDTVNYQPAPQQPPAPQYEQRPSPSRGRRRGSGQWQQQIAQLQPPPRVYSPSVFENLALGMPPAGVSIPEDSFLNVLRNDGRGVRARQNPVYEPSPPQHTSFVQSPPTQTFRAPVSSNLPYSGVPATAPRRVQQIEPVPTGIQHQPQIERPQTESIQTPVQYQAPQAPVQAPLQPTPQRSSIRRSGTRYRQTTDARPSWRSAPEEPQRPPRVYSPSVFENLGLGVAPSGIDVPEDSLLNILRNDKPNFRTRRNQDYEPAPPPPPVMQNTPVQYSAEPPNPIQPHSAEFEVPQQIENVAPAPRRVNRRPPPQQRPQPEFVDNSANQQVAEEQPQVVQHPKPVQNRRRITVRRHRQYSPSTTGTDSNDEELDQPPKQFAPSVFEKIGLGEAPPGIYYPEDSFLNLLRGERPITRAAQRPVNQPAHIPQAAPPRRVAPDVSVVQSHPGSDYSIQQDSYYRQNRRSRMTYANQAPTQQHQNPPPQEYQEPANIQPQHEYQRPVSQQIHQPAVAPRPVQPPKRQRQRSRTQPIRAPEPQPVYEAPEAIYNVSPDLQQEDDILRYRAPDNNQRSRQQEPLPQYRREDAAPRHVPPPQPVYEDPQPHHNTNHRFQQDDDIQRRRPQPGNQRRTQVQAPVQRPRTDSQSRPSQPQNTRVAEVPETRQQSRFKPAKLSVKPLPDDVDGDQIPGEGGVDYPTLHVIPKTSFSCAQQPHNGYYADLETSCQVVHMCQAGGVQSSFLCPNGTIFNQEKFSCQWWYKVNCEDAPSHYAINDKLYKVPPKPSRRSKK